MNYELGLAGLVRLEEFLNLLGAHLRDKRKRASFAMYAFGLLGEGDRKSVEPIAARVCGGSPLEVNRTHHKLLHFLGSSKWDDRKIRQVAAEYAISAIEQREEITTWIVDDTGFLKQGEHSVGVQRQYTGSAGKVANCQIGVSLAVATSTQHLPVDFELYLPRSWAEDQEKRRKVRIPEEVQFKTKPALALDMVARAHDAGIPGDIILADSAYGDSNDFRNGIRFLGFDYGVGIKRSTNVVRVHPNGKLYGETMSVAKLSENLSFRKMVWREGSNTTLHSRFAFARVKTTHDDGLDIDERETVWLVVDWPEGEEAPSKFFLTTLPGRMSRRKTVRILKERWRTERMYEDLKGELGLDHFEGRSYPGWHHHVSVVLCCYAFVISERARSFSPSAFRSRSGGPHVRETRATLRRLFHYRTHRHRQTPCAMAPAMSTMPPASSPHARTRQTLRQVGLNLRQ